MTEGVAYKGSIISCRYKGEIDTKYRGFVIPTKGFVWET